MRFDTKMEIQFISCISIRHVKIVLHEYYHDTFVLRYFPNLASAGNLREAHKQVARVSSWPLLRTESEFLLACL